MIYLMTPSLLWLTGKLTLRLTESLHNDIYTTVLWKIQKFGELPNRHKELMCAGRRPGRWYVNKEHVLRQITYLVQ
jgi:hypothetical protein